MRLIGVDVGGTFTDIVFHDTQDGTTRINKVPTTPDNPARGVLGGNHGTHRSVRCRAGKH